MKNQRLAEKLKEVRKVYDYSHYETGKRIPDHEALFKLAFGRCSRITVFYGRIWQRLNA